MSELGRDDAREREISCPVRSPPPMMGVSPAQRSRRRERAMEHEGYDDWDDLFSGVRRGDRGAADLLFGRLTPYLLRIVLDAQGLPGTSRTARDIVQEAYLRLLPHLREIDNAKGLREYLRVVLRNLLREYGRKRT